MKITFVGSFDPKDVKDINKVVNDFQQVRLHFTSDTIESLKVYDDITESVEMKCTFNDKLQVSKITFRKKKVGEKQNDV